MQNGSLVKIEILFIEIYVSSVLDIGDGSCFTTENEYYYYTTITIGDC